MTWDICIIQDSVINGVNYCCHPVCYRTVQSLYAAALAWWGESTVLWMKRSQVQSQQQFMCASLQRRTFKSYSLQGVEMHHAYIHPSQRDKQRKKEREKNLLITRLCCTVCGDSLLIKGFHAPKQKLHLHYMHQYLKADHWYDCWYSILLLLPSCSISGPHSETGHNSNFNMDQSGLTGKIGCDLLGIGSIYWTNYPCGDGNILV